MIVVIVTMVSIQFYYQTRLYESKENIKSTNNIAFFENLTREPHTMFEVLNRERFIKPYFDYDEIIRSGKKRTKTVTDKAYRVCKQEILSFFPDLKWKDVAIAERHGYSPSHDCEKISWRFFINGVKTNLETMRILSKRFSTLSGLDNNCYNSSQKMGMLYGHKGNVINKNKVYEVDKRILMPYTKSKSMKDFVIQHVESNWKTYVIENTQTCIGGTRDSELDEIRKLVRCLSNARSNNERTWVQVGWCLHNIQSIDNMHALELWVEFSRKSYKFKSGECEEKWKHFKFEGLNIGSLHMWAKEDNASEYEHIIQDRIVDDISACDGTDNSVANIMHKVLKEKFVCASCDSNSWYYYDGHLWREDIEALELRKQFSTILKQFESIHPTKIHAQPDTEYKSFTKIVKKLKTHNFKKAVIKECTEYFYDGNFLKRLDADPNLIGFDNGVFHLREKTFVTNNPMDFVSLSVGYDYLSIKNTEYYNKVVQYFHTLHPTQTEREYILRTLARQLYGDTGKELLHVHCGYNGSAANGKTKSWEINKLCFGDYVQKIEVGILVNKKRKESGTPSPEFRLWKGKRLLYCTEPNPTETLNSGTMKDLTGGEQVVYRLLFSNIFDQYIPQWKLHIMTNDLPTIDGTDEGVKRRLRVFPYVSTFVDKEHVNESKHMYYADTEITYAFRENDKLKMEYMRYVLEHYKQDWDYRMTDIIRSNSQAYLFDNDMIGKFVSEFLERDNESFVTLKELKEAFKCSDCYDGGNTNNIKIRFERSLNTKCQEQKKQNGVKYKNVFFGYKFTVIQIETDL